MGTGSRPLFGNLERCSVCPLANKNARTMALGLGGKEEEGDWKNEPRPSSVGALATAHKCSGFKIVCNKHSPKNRGKLQGDVGYNLGISVILSSAHRRG